MWDESLKFMEGAITATGSKQITLDDNPKHGRTLGGVFRRFFYDTPPGPLAGLGIGSNPARFGILVTESFNNLTSLRFTLSVSKDNTNFDDVWDTGAVARANLTAGKYWDITVPNDEAMKDAKYMRAGWAVAGTAPTTGKVYIGMVEGIPVTGAQELTDIT